MIEKGAGDNVCDPGKITSVKIAKVIEIKAKKGMGTEEDPVREITQYWDLEGNLLIEKDPYLYGEQTYSESKE